ncbi:MAG: FTR1 family protein [Nodosilinea sp.]
MDLTTALPTALITWREGVEAALVVGIVMACLNQAHRQSLYPWVYLGVVAGLIGSTTVGLALTLGLQQVQRVLPHLQAVVTPLLNMLFGTLAIVMLSWMLVWMTRQARSLKGDLEGRVGSVLQDQESAGWSLFSLVCVAILREGFETVLFVFTNLEAGLGALVGALAGLIGAVLVGLALFRWGIAINLKQFFQVMGVLLLLIVAGLVLSVFKHLDAGLAALSQIDGRYSDLCMFQNSCVLGPLVWDTSGFLSDRQFPGILLKTLLGYRDHLYLLPAIAYLGFWLIVGGNYFRSLKPLTLVKPLSAQE